MVLRKRKKKEKLRGHRSHGKGNTKNKRGAGCRGGRGRAGSHKHKYSKYYADFGVKRTLKRKKRKKALNLDDLEREIKKLVAQKKIETQAGLLVVDGRQLGYGKILSRGTISEKILVKNIDLSEKAREKIESAGGKIGETAKGKETVEKDKAKEKASDETEGKEKGGSKE